MRIAVFLLLLAVFMPFPAGAYLDPGTGSMIVHLIIGAIAGGLVTLKVYWSKCKRFFTRSASSGDGTGGNP
jgi:hypothetical protein